MLHDDPPTPKLLDFALGTPKLLVVDDQPAALEAMYQAFVADFQVLIAASGARALSICQDTPPDLILLDAMMPDMNGFEVFTRLKADAASRDTPVIFVTGHNDAAQETLALQMGAVDCISRPVNPALARARIKSHLTLKLQADAMYKLDFLDGLTGAFNQRYFDQQLGTELARSARNRSALNLVLIEVDYFREFNDCYGHESGDDCLRQIAGTLKAGLRRPADLVARHGGNTFACLLPETDFDNAMAVACELELRVRGKGFSHEASDAATIVTISLGVAGRVGTAAIDATGLLALANAQLGKAIQAGRGRVAGDLLR
jgi:diguanylate cyclase (GGDEF)-like protein